MSFLRRFLHRLAHAAAAGSVLAGCAHLEATSATPPTTSAVPRPAAAPAPPAVPLRPFADVVKDAKRSDGLFPLWQKDDKVWIEIAEADLNQPFFLAPKIKTGIGERYFFGGLLGFEDGIVEFRRIHNQIQLLWRNTEFVARPGSPEAFAVAAAYSPSLIASAPVQSQPHPQRGTVLVDAGTLFVADLMGTGAALQRTYRQGYSFDARNSSIGALRNSPQATTIEVLNHFATAVVSPPQVAQPGAMVPSVPRSVPDARSLFVTMHYTLARLPEQPLRPRLADARIGHFTTTVFDFGDDLARSPRQRYVSRWRLEKQDPDATLSEPVKPIVFWLDRTIPHKYRAAVTAGVLEWNKAFEAIGFKNALRVEVQPADADFDTLDHGRAAIRWMTNSQPAFGGIGQRHIDPRTGEILHAGIALESLDARNVRAVRSQAMVVASPGHAHGAACEFADHAGEQLAYALELLDARGEIDPDSPEAQKWVEDYVRQVTLHEVGHTLGLRHNFRASRAYTDAQLADPAFTAAHGTTASVMEYMPINLNAPHERRALHGVPFTTALGPYDYWAIEYAYRPFDAAEESAALARIAARSAEPLLAFGTDEDTSLGVDPEVLQLDLGSDVVAFARKRLAIAQDMLRRQEVRELRADQGYAVLRRSVVYAVNDVGRASSMLARQIGGVRTLRDAPGSGRDPLQPLPAAQQREALALITTELLAADSLRISPALQRRLAPDFQVRRDAVDAGDGAGTDYSISTQVLDVQRSLLAALMSDGVAVRLLDSAQKAGPGDAAALTVAELYASLAQAVWSEIDSGAKVTDIAPRRRELQREHVNRVSTLLLRPQSLSRADARSLLRAQARTLAKKIDSASRRAGLTPETRAHLQDSADTLTQALAAQMVRSGT